MREGSKNTDIRILNQGLILQQIAVNRGISRVEIASKTNLTKTTISNVVQELINQGYVTEEITPPEKSRYASSGRPPVQLRISKDAPLICGMLIKRKKTTVLLGNLEGDIVDSISERFTGFMDPDNLIDFILSSYKKLMERNKCKIWGIGISAMGIADSISGTLLNPPNYFSRPTDLPIVDILRKEIKQPIYLMHDTGSCILAEQIYATESLPKNFSYVTFQSGIGAGFVLNGEVANGQRGHSGELGHMSINKDGERCVCGNKGCLEGYASLENMIRRLKEFSHVLPEHPLIQKKDLSFADFVNEAKNGDSLALSILEEFTKYLSVAFINMVNLLDITHYIIEYEGGSGSRLLEDFLEQSVNRLILASDHRRVTIQQSKFGEILSPVSTIAIVAARVFSGEIKL